MPTKLYLAVAAVFYIHWFFFVMVPLNIFFKATDFGFLLFEMLYFKLIAEHRFHSEPHYPFLTP